jgi:hypothetical protein
MKCSECSIEQPDSNFAWRNKSKGIRHKICRKCQSTYSKKHYRNNKEKKIIQRIIRRRKIREWFKKYKSTLQCEECGEDYPACLVFHHISNKDDNIGNLIRLGWSKERILEEIDKCEVLCANCHRKKHWKEKT